VTPLKIPTVEQIIQTLPQNSSSRASDAASPHTDVSAYRTLLSYWLPTHSVGGQTSNGHRCLSSSSCVVFQRLSSLKLPVGGPAGYWVHGRSAHRAHGRSGGLHITADQCGYVPLV